MSCKPLKEPGSASSDETNGPTTSLSDEPAVPSALSDEPAVPSALSDEPAVPSALSDEPAAPSALSDEPAAPSALSDEPAAPSALSDEPAAPSALSDEPAAPSALSEEPAVPSALSEEPAVPSALSEEPAVPSALSEEPAVPSALSEEPAVSQRPALCLKNQLCPALCCPAEEPAVPSALSEEPAVPSAFALSEEPAVPSALSEEPAVPSALSEDPPTVNELSDFLIESAATLKQASESLEYCKIPVEAWLHLVEESKGTLIAASQIFESIASSLKSFNVPKDAGPAMKILAEALEKARNAAKEACVGSPKPTGAIPKKPKGPAPSPVAVKPVIEVLDENRNEPAVARKSTGAVPKKRKAPTRSPGDSFNIKFMTENEKDVVFSRAPDVYDLFREKTEKMESDTAILLSKYEVMRGHADKCMEPGLDLTLHSCLMKMEEVDNLLPDVESILQDVSESLEECTSVKLKDSIYQNKHFGYDDLRSRIRMTNGHLDQLLADVSLIIDDLGVYKNNLGQLRDKSASLLRREV
ncbi:hypothetical protein CDAR_305191 [Caerostris darwini]|uniref:Uncharacterized protein n=1 Tax=Caerostris darwini TaxID=1538125 RepID=A0AAV4MB43_9ARAC|nr:hypothetical protein CDAR_305191 [Caerostris darwini]